jgi:hypothetical protein
LSDLLTESVLPVLGLCPPGGLLLPWLSHARAVTGRPLELPAKAYAATFAVSRRAAGHHKAPGTAHAPVAAVLLEEAGTGGQPSQATLVMMDWGSELGPHSGAALRRADPRQIFGIDLPVRRRCLLMLSEDDCLPQRLLRETARQLELEQEELGWLGLRALLESLGEFLGRVPRDRYRAPERTAQELVARLGRHGVRPFRPPAGPREGLSRPSWRRYEPLTPGTRETPWRFAASETVGDAAMVLEAQILRRKERWRARA